LRYIESEGGHIHGNINLSSIFVNDAGEWQVGGLEVASEVIPEQESILFTYGSLLPVSSRYAPPEVAKEGWQTSQRLPSTVDSWQAGVLIYETFNGPIAASGAIQIPSSRGKIPSALLWNIQKTLTNQNPKQRVRIPKMLENSQAAEAFHSTMSDISEALKSLSIASDYQFNDFLEKVADSAAKFPSQYVHYKLLPELVKCMDLGKGGIKALTAIVQFGKDLTPAEHQTTVGPVIVKLYASSDRAIRMQLLNSLPDYIELLDKKLVPDKIFRQWSSGFSDTEPAIREESVKSVLHIIGKLSNRQANGDLLRLLAKTQNDPIPEIRANTTILLGRVAEKFAASTRASVLVAAFTRALKDPYLPSRLAALLALSATAEYFSPQDCCQKLMGPLCLVLLDNEKSVRDQAAITVDMFMNKIMAQAKSMNSESSGGRPASPSISSRWGLSLGLTNSNNIEQLARTLSAPAGDQVQVMKPVVTENINRSTTKRSIADWEPQVDEYEDETHQDENGWGFDGGFDDDSSEQDSAFGQNDRRVSKLSLEPEDAGGDDWSSWD
jgi:SCY1-like protein 1